MFQYDLVVVGSGPAGRRGAIQAAKLGKKVLVIEQGKRVGGVSVHTGTIPSKTLRETALNLSGWRERGFYGKAYRVKEEISADDLRRRLLITLDHEVEVLEHQFARNRVQHIRGKASFADPSTLEVVKDDGEVLRVTGASILLAVGTKPFRPDYIPFDNKTVLDSDELLEIQELPRSMTVIGAGVIGIEYATIFSALDTAVTVIDPKPTMLDFIDKEIIEDFTYQLRDRNMKILLGTKADTVTRLDNGKVELLLDNGRRLVSDMVLFAAGRMGATDTLNLAAAGLQAAAVASRSIPRPSRPRCRTSMRPATSSVFRALLPPRWNRAASRRVSRSVPSPRSPRSISRMASMPCLKFRPAALRKRR
jgi:NAD(P) transhydrogenase